jgi:peptidoglycan hydrolase CwlO-like protein
MLLTIELALLFSGVSVAAALFFGISNLKRNEEKDAREEAAQMTTVIVKLETISNGVFEIKSELSAVKEDVKENGERLTRCEESVKQAHKRIDTCEKFHKNGGQDERV